MHVLSACIKMHLSKISKPDLLQNYILIIIQFTLLSKNEVYTLQWPDHVVEYIVKAIKRKFNLSCHTMHYYKD